MRLMTSDTTVIYPHSLLSERPTKRYLEAVKTRQRSIWAGGDIGRIGVLPQAVGESLCEAVELRAGEKVLDVAAGHGNASLAAARRYAEVTSTDYGPEHLTEGLRRAEVEGVRIVTRVADSENLPFRDAEFDVALSAFGVMFAPNQEAAAAELINVVRSGGRIGLANWTPGGFVGALLGVVGWFVAPAPGTGSPVAWGTESRVIELFGAHSTGIHIQRKHLVFHYLSAEHWIDVSRRRQGPLLSAFEALDARGQRNLHAALVDLLERHDRGGRKSLIVPAEYLEIVVRRV